MKADDILYQAIETLTERGVGYDTNQGERTLTTLVPVFNQVTRNNLSLSDAYTFMVLLKLIRSRQGTDKLDNWLDMAAYAALGGETLQE
jgi:hypothetical protein